MAPVAKKKAGGKGTMGFLTKKELGLPIWAWGLIVSVLLFFLYKHFKGASTTTPAAASTDATTGDFPATTADDGSGGTAGGGTDSSGDLSDIAASLQNEPQAIADLLGAQGFLQTQPLANGTNPYATTGIAGVGPLDWGGQPFTSRSQFNAYLKSKGLSVTQFEVMHPAAYAHYLALPSGVTATKNSKKPGTPKLATKSSTKTLATSAKHVATTVTSFAKPKKAPVVTTHKAPMQTQVGIFGKLQSGKVATVNHPSALVGSTNKSAVKKAVNTPSPVKSPAKTAAKPTPKTSTPIAKPVAHKPPAKAKK